MEGESKKLKDLIGAKRLKAFGIFSYLSVISLTLVSIGAFIYGGIELGSTFYQWLQYIKTIGILYFSFTIFFELLYIIFAKLDNHKIKLIKSFFISFILSINVNGAFLLQNVSIYGYFLAIISIIYLIIYLVIAIKIYKLKLNKGKGIK